jgi:pentatricopeptide repeat protein
VFDNSRKDSDVQLHFQSARTLKTPSAYVSFLLSLKPEERCAVVPFILDDDVAIDAHIFNCLAVPDAWLVHGEECLAVLRNVLNGSSPYSNHPIVQLFKDNGLISLLCNIIQGAVACAKDETLGAWRSVAFGKSTDTATYLALLEKLKACNIQPNSGTYKWMIRAFGDCYKQTAMREIIAHMEDNCETITEDVYRVAVKKYCAFYDVHSVDKVWGKLENRLLNRRTYESVLRAYMWMGKVDKVLVVYEGMRKNSIVPTLDMLGSLISWFGEIQQTNVAQKLFEYAHTLEVGEKALTVHNAMLHAYGCAKDIAGMQRQFNLMLAQGVQPDVTSFAVTFRHLVDCRDLQKAEELMTMMETSGLRIEERLYAHLLKAYLRSDKQQDAWNIIKRLRAKEMTPHSSLFELFVHYGLANDVACVRKVLEEMKADDAMPLLARQQQIVRFLTEWRMHDTVLEFVKWIYRFKNKPTEGQGDKRVT